MENRKCPIRVPAGCEGRPISHFQIRTHDHLANPYYAIAAIVALGLHGVKNELPLVDPVETDPLEVTQ